MCFIFYLFYLSIEMLQAKTMSRINKIIDYIRERCQNYPSIAFADVCVDMGIMPPTLYNYIKLMQRIAPDIIYENQRFSIGSIDR